MAYDGDKDRDEQEALAATAPYISRELSAQGAPEPETDVSIGEVVGPEDPPRRGAEELVLARQPPRERHPVVVYLASLSEGSRRAMRASLENIAQGCGIWRRFAHVCWS